MVNRKLIFPIPNNAAEGEEVDPVTDMFASFGIEPPAEEGGETETETEQPEQPEQEVVPTETPEANTEGESPAEQPEQDKPKPDNKQAKAWAEMRVQNKNYEKILKGVAGVLGVEGTNPDAMLQALNDKVNEAQAKAQGVPKELLERLNQLEERDKMFEQEEIKRNAYLGFQNLKNDFGLDDKALSSFADELIQEGLNPFEQHVDIETAFIKTHYKDLISQAEERGIKREQERAAKANTQGSTPNNKNGQDPGGVQKINNIADLNKWYDSVSK